MHMISAYVYNAKMYSYNIMDKKLNWIIHTYTRKTNTQSLNIIKKRRSNKMALVKFIFNVWRAKSCHVV